MAEATNQDTRSPIQIEVGADGRAGAYFLCYADLGSTWKRPGNRDPITFAEFDALMVAAAREDKKTRQIVYKFL